MFNEEPERKDSTGETVTKPIFFCSVAFAACGQLRERHTVEKREKKIGRRMKKEKRLFFS